MSDECDLDELTAFLEASDDEAGTKDKVSNENVLEDVEKSVGKIDHNTEMNDKKDENYECNQDEIEAFLQASDDEEDDVETKVTVDNGEVTEVKEDKHNEDDMDFEDFEEGDFQELDNMMDSQNVATSQEEAWNHSETDGYTDKSGVEESDPGEVKTESEKTDGADNEEIGSESEDAAHELIEAEMAAMARRMEELKSMLKQSKSSPSSCKKQSKSHSDSVDIKSISNLDLERKRTKCSAQFVKKNPGNSPVSGKKKSKPVTDCAKNMTLVKKSASDPLREQSDKYNSLSDDKEKKGKSGKHFNSREKLKTTSPCSKVKISGTNTQKTDSNLASTVEQDESNPFFTKTKEIADLKHQQPASLNKIEENTVDSKTLFGDSDDSDWDDLAGEEKSNLSKEGKELKKLINSGQKKREAHTPSFNPAILQKPNTARWTETNLKPVKIYPIQKVSQKPAVDPVTGTVSGKYKVRDEYMQRSSIAKEDERESVTDPFCGIRIINPRVPMDVFQKKMEGRNLVKISKLSLKVGMSDLQKENWVTLGVVVHKTEPRQSAAGKAYCIWKLSDLQNCDKTVTFFLFGNVYKEHWKNDLGVVIGLLNPSMMDKAEKNQAEVAITINHPQQLLMMGISKDLGRCRGTTKAGQPCSSFINKMQGEFCTYHVQAAYRKSSSKRTELQASTGVTPKAFTHQKNKNAGSGCFFYGGNTYTTQRPQAKSSKDTVTLKKLQSFDSKKAPGKITTMSLHDLEPDDEKRIDKIREKDKDLLKLLSVPSAGSMNFVKHLVKKDANPTVNKNEEVLAPSVSAKDLLKEHSKILVQKKQQVKLLSGTPTLGKGFSLGQEISLDAPIKKGKGCASAELAKQLAISKVKAKGGINKEDPNAVRKKLTSPEARDKIKKRVAEDMEEDSNSGEAGSREPPKKKSKLLGDLDLNSPEVQKLLKKKSKHQGALAEAEAEHEDRYFSALEKKEQMEEKMDAIMEVPVKLFVCVQCKYRYFSVHERCKTDNHTIKVTKGVKRFFKCKQCKKRTISIDRLPTKPCKDCGEASWERVSMLKERKGPKLESEELCLRGNEQKFIGSLQGQASFNG